MRGHLILSVVVLSACASGGSSVRPESPETVRIGMGGTGNMQLNVVSTNSTNVSNIEYPLDKVWLVLQTAFDSLGIPTNSVDPKTHSMGNAGYKVRRQIGNVALSKYIDCGNTQGPPSADTYEIQLSVMTQLTPGTPSGTTVTTTVDALGRPITLSGEYRRCASKGTIEPAIAAIVTKRLLR